MIPKTLQKTFEIFDAIEFRDIAVNKERTRNVVFLNLLIKEPNISTELSEALKKGPELIIDGIKIADNYFVVEYSKSKFHDFINSYLSLYDLKEDNAQKVS
jgi:hypothetical protein